MNKIKLYIVGCGNVGGFVAYNFDSFNTEEYEIHGFLDDDTGKYNKTIFGFPVLGGIDMLDLWSDKTAVVIGIADPLMKKNVKERINLPNVVFPSLISKSAWVSNQVTIGEGTVIYPGVTIDYDVVIEDFVLVNKNCSLGHNSMLSKFSTLAPGVSLAGFTYLEECVNVGINAATIQNVHIGQNSIIGGMSMVIKDLPENITAVGVPAKIIKSNT
ncbi:MAG: acetyltransferase [Chitinophagaceae bacterium]|nr:acetyltransferase [Chitinophagaceae bacterium]